MLVAFTQSLHPAGGVAGSTLLALLPIATLLVLFAILRVTERVLVRELDRVLGRRALQHDGRRGLVRPAQGLADPGTAANGSPVDTTFKWNPFVAGQRGHDRVAAVP
ncbi:MAG TPA: hypothetical protein VGF23_10050, partial [Gaiellaceae bacterium]